MNFYTWGYDFLLTYDHDESVDSPLILPAAALLSYMVITFIALLKNYSKYCRCLETNQFHA